MKLNESSLAVDPSAPVLQLRDACGAEWPNIKASREQSAAKNTTQRLLLLLESACIGPARAYEHVVESILTRYIEEDLLSPNDTPFRVPRFLLNDFARYWRTMAVDFAHKRRVRQADKWALRTTKLRLSRKLLYSAGLLSCYLCGEQFRAARRTNPYHDARQVTQFLAQLVGTTPLDIVARVVIDSFGETSVAGRDVFNAYDEFLGVMNDEGKRDTLERLRPEEADSNAVFQEARQLGTQFHDALTRLFFEGPLRDFTIRYGVF
jgi:hypothetical protein